MNSQKNAIEIAETFNKSYEQLWERDNLNDLMKLYSTKSILMGHVTVNGKDEIQKALEGIKNQGWTKIKIKTVKVETLGENILVANEYEAFSSENNGKQSIKGKSSQVLTKEGNSWCTAMHTTT